MNFLTINEDKTIWFGLIVSLMIHGLVLSFSRGTIIQHAQYSVQPSAQMVEVSIEETKVQSQSVILSPRPLSPILTDRRSVGRAVGPEGEGPQGPQTGHSHHSHSGVLVKANPGSYQNPPPEYPELARQMRQEGLVLLGVDVNAQGLPDKVVIAQSSGFRLLDQAALRAVSRWKFQPGRIGEFSKESEVTVPVRFRLEQ